MLTRGAAAWRGEKTSWVNKSSAGTKRRMGDSQIPGSSARCDALVKAITGRCACPRSSGEWPAGYRRQHGAHRRSVGPTGSGNSERLATRARWSLQVGPRKSFKRVERARPS